MEPELAHGSLIRFDNPRAGTDNNGMNVSLPMPLEEFVRRKVAAGEFHSADEVVCEGLLLLQNRDTWKAEAGQKIEAGWQQAKSGQLHTPEKTQESLAARKALWKSRQGR